MSSFILASYAKVALLHRIYAKSQEIRPIFKDRGYGLLVSRDIGVHKLLRESGVPINPREQSENTPGTLQIYSRGPEIPLQANQSLADIEVLTKVSLCTAFEFCQILYVYTLRLTESDVLLPEINRKVALF